jgi:PAS domain S-box-containing protein
MTTELDKELQNPAFRALFEQTREAVMLAELKTTFILEANPRALALLGYSQDEIRNLTLTDLSPRSNHDIIGNFIGENRQATHPSTLTTRLQSKVGDPVPCELSIRPFATEKLGLLLISFQDISERIQAMEDIELRNVAIANVTSGVTIADARQPDLPLIYVNQGFQKITGYSAREAVGRSCRFLQGEDREQPELEKLRKSLREADPCVVRLRNYKKDGTLFYNELHISPVRNEEDELTHFVGIQLDVTEQVKARESLERSEQRYRQALEREQELNEIKTRFISMVSHEFRTPMTGIRSSAALVRKFGDKLGKEKINRHLINIDNSLKRMNRLLDDVLFFSRAEADKLKVNRTEVGLRTYFQKLIEGLAPIHPNREINFEDKLPEEDVFPLDEHLLDHIFHNLIGNAVKYSPADSTVTCTASCTAETVEIAIRDFGIGIPESDQHLLFEAFHRAGNVGARQGTGLGLNIALRAVELLGGNLTFESTQGQGSIFSVHLPITQQPEPTT